MERSSTAGVARSRATHRPRKSRPPNMPSFKSSESARRVGGEHPGVGQPAQRVLRAARRPPVRPVSAAGGYSAATAAGRAVGPNGQPAAARTASQPACFANFVQHESQRHPQSRQGQRQVAQLMAGAGSVQAIYRVLQDQSSSRNSNITLFAKADLVL